jgi:hypothetical protein
MSEIHEVVKELEVESKAIIKELYRLAWFMRGALNIEQAYMLDYDSRAIIAEIVESNLETTKETKLPFF